MQGSAWFPRAFRGNSVGVLARGSVVVRSAAGRSVVASARAESPLRLLEPRRGVMGTAAAVCLVTYGGGMVAADAIEVDLGVEAGATLLVFTQSSTKVFRGASRQSVRARVDGTLVLLPDPVAAFADAAFAGTVDVELGPDGSAVVLDGFTSGRAAFGERWAMERIDLRTTIRRGAEVVVDDALRLDRGDGSIGDRLATHEALLTLVAVGQGARPVAEAILREPFAPPTPDLFVAASPLPRDPGGAILRVAASQPGRALEEVRRRLGNLPEMGVVDPFASRR